MGIRIRFFTLLSLLLTVAVYAGLGTVAAGCGTTSTGSATDEGGAEALTAVETSLYDSGTYDFPVTIAKLDSPALELVTVTVEAVSVSTESISANLVRYAEGDPGYLYTIAVSGIDYATTPKFIVYNEALGTSGIFDVSVDGLTVATILGNLEDAILFANMNAAEDQVSPFLSVKTDEDGNLGAVGLINTGDLMADQDLMVDGYYHLSIANDDGTFTFLRRNLDGSAVEIIAADLTSQVRVVTAVNGDQIMVILQDGTVLHFVSASSTASVNALVAGSISPPQAETTTWTSTEIDAIVGGLVEFSTMADSGNRLFMNSVGTVLYHLRPPVDADGNPNVDYLIMHDLTDGVGENVLIDSASFGQKVFMDLGETDVLYIVALWPGEVLPSLSRFSLTTVWNPTEQSTFMATREVLIANLGGILVESIDVSDDGVVALTATKPVSLVSQILFWTEEFGMKEITDPSTSTAGQFTTARIAPDGNSIVFCEVVASGDNFLGAVRVHVPLLHAEHEFVSVIESTERDYCTNAPGSIFIDGNGFIYLYEMMPLGIDGLPQLLVIDPRMHPAF